MRNFIWFIICLLFTWGFLCNADIVEEVDNGEAPIICGEIGPLCEHKRKSPHRGKEERMIYFKRSQEFERRFKQALKLTNVMGSKKLARDLKALMQDKHIHRVVKRSQTGTEELISNYPQSSPLKDVQYDHESEPQVPNILGQQPEPIVNILDDQNESEMADMDKKRNWQWCLLTLDGNATIIQRRKDDFIRYLKMNLASLVGLDYDLILFNTVSYTPTILVNVTMDFQESNRITSSLNNLAKNNDTLLDLSGAHFNLTHFLPRSAIMAPKLAAPVENNNNSNLLNPKEMEAFIYLSVGAAIVFLLLASLMFAVCQCISRPRVNKPIEEREPRTRGERRLVRSEESNGRLLISQYSLDELSTRKNSQPKLIYSQSFSDGLSHRQAGPSSTYQTPKRYTPLDESLAPLASFEEEDFIPRFVHRNADSQSDIISPRTEILNESSFDVTGSELDRPFSVQSMRSRPGHAYNTTQRHNAHRLSRGSYLPMAPVFPAVTIETPSEHSDQHSLPISSSRPASRATSSSMYSTDSAALPHRYSSAMSTSQSFNNGRYSSFKPLKRATIPVPPERQMTPEEIERDVRTVLRNMGLENPSYD